MKPAVISQLLELNRQFYQTFGADFSATRGRIQPGVRKILDGIALDTSILDVGCGNGEFIRQALARGHRAPILGVDFSLPLLKDAERIPQESSVKFLAMDIARDDWSQITETYALITSFATLHHIPGEETRLRILREAAARLAPRGRLILSNWQFLNSERLRKRIQPWGAVGLEQSEVDGGDYLLDWRRGGTGLRYVHHFSADELSHLAEMSGFSVLARFWSDGASGNLGLYQVWEKRA